MFLANIPNLAIPGIKKIGLFLLVYILLVGPINYIVLKKFRHLEWAWFTIPVIIIVFTGVAYGMAKATKGNQLISTQASYIYAGESTSWGLEKCYSGLFSPTKTSYDISSVNEDGIVESISDNRFETTDVNYRFEDEMSIDNIPIRMWEMARFSTSAPVNLDKGIRASLTYNTDSTLKGKITNGTPYSFSQIWLVSTQFSLEDKSEMYSGDEWEIDTMVNNFTIPIENQFSTLRPERILRGGQEINPPLKEILADANLEYNFAETGGCLFIGRIQDSVSNLEVTGYSPIDSGERYVIVPLSIKINGDQGIIPPSMAKMDILSHTDYSIPTQTRITTKFKYLIGQGKNIIEFKLPLDGRLHKLQEIEYSYRFSNSSLKNMEIFNWYNGRWERLENYGQSSGSNIKIKDADRYLRQTDSRIRIRVDFDQSGARIPVIVDEFNITSSYTKRNV
jgi:hypothetical protein